MTRQRDPRQVRSCRPGGFTIVEILVVIGIMVVLMGLLMPALRSMKTAGRQTVEMSAARQLMIAYTSYANHYNDRVLPGYNTDLMARDASGRRIGEDILTDFRGPAARGRYPWRLAPFLSYNFRGLYLNEQQELLEMYEQEDADMYAYLVSLFPSMGLNTTWLGGDEDIGGFDKGNLQTYGQFYAVSTTQIHNPARMLVFASARGAEDPFDPGAHEGYFRLTSPYLREGDGYLWQESFNPGDRPSEFGYVSPRYDGSAVTAFADGHVDVLRPDEFKDMRLWADKATREDWELPVLNPSR